MCSLCKPILHPFSLHGIIYDGPVVSIWSLNVRYPRRFHRWMQVFPRIFLTTYHFSPRITSVRKVRARKMLYQTRKKHVSGTSNQGHRFVSYLVVEVCEMSTQYRSVIFKLIPGQNLALKINSVQFPHMFKTFQIAPLEKPECHLSTLWLSDQPYQERRFCQKLIVLLISASSLQSDWRITWPM